MHCASGFQPLQGCSEERQRRHQRRERFAISASSVDSDGDDDPAEGSFGGNLVGRCCALFKPFVRLRTAPDPASVRPESFLRASLAALLDEDARPAGGWAAVREQLWSIRQDLTVQNLHQSAFAAEFGVEGMRLAVQADDVGELQRCVRPLVANGPCAHRVRNGPEHVSDEVYGVRLLYLTHGGVRGSPGRLESELLDFVQRSPPAFVRVRSPLQYAYRVHAARTIGLWTRQLRLANEDHASSGVDCRGSLHPSRHAATGPDIQISLCRRLAKNLTSATRSNALVEIVRAFPQGIAASRAASLLGFDGGVAEFSKWLRVELRLDGAAPSGRPLGAAGRLNCHAVSGYLDRLREVAVRRSAERLSSLSKLEAGLVGEKLPIRGETDKRSLLASALGNVEWLAQDSITSKERLKKRRKEARKEKKRVKKEKKRAKRMVGKEARRDMKRKRLKMSDALAISPDPSHGKARKAKTTFASSSSSVSSSS